MQCSDRDGFVQFKTKFLECPSFFQSTNRNPDLLAGQFQPWKEEGSFCWDTYLEFSNAKAAPSKLFKCPFPPEDNPFKLGMKLESIDPEHPALFCVVTVVEIVGWCFFLSLVGQWGAISSRWQLWSRIKS